MGLFNNGSLIGKRNAPSVTGASGVWDLREHFLSKLDGIWPKSIETDGLVFYIDAGDVSSYPGSGTSVSDLSGLSNDGTLVNGVSYDSANGGSFVFDGTDDYIDLQNDTDWNSFGDSITVEVVFKQTVQSSFQRLVAKQTTATTTASSCFQMGINSNETFRFSVNTDAGSVDASSDLITVDRIYHFVGTYDGSLVKRYVDSVEIGSDALTGNILTSSEPLILGTSYYSGTTQYYLQGNIYEVRIYNRALTAGQVAANFALIRDRYGI